MGIASIKKIQIIAHSSDKNRIVDELHRLGAVQISNLKEEPLDYGDLLVHRETSTEDVEQRISELQYILNCLSQFEKEKKGLLESLLKGKTILTPDELDGIIKRCGIDKIGADCRNLDKSLNGLKVKESKIKNEMHNLTPWIKLSLPVEEVEDTRKTRFLCGVISPEMMEGLKVELSKFEESYLEIISEEKNKTYFLLIFLKENEEDIFNLLKEYEFNQTLFSNLRGTVSEILKMDNQLLEEVADEREKLNQRGVKLLEANHELQALYDYFFNLKDKKQIQNYFVDTKHTFLLEGWLRKKDIEMVEKDLLNLFREIEITISDPDEGDQPPIDLSNAGLVSPFETITKLYGLPNYKELDPTPLLAPFFFIFFGLCLTDAGYGVVIAILTYLGLRKFVLGKGEQHFYQLLFFCGIATIFCGAITGSWFGDIIDLLPEGFNFLKVLKNKFILFEPMKDPLIFMILSLCLGFIQVWFGIVVKMYKNIRGGDITSAILDQVPWLVILIGIVLWGLIGADSVDKSWEPLIKGVVLLGALSIIVFNGRTHKNILKRAGLGLLGLYDAVGYFSDILSYCRLLALGLATAVIATVINKIALMSLALPYIGFIFMFLILIGGHLFNLVINALGAFIHSLRLQFVEFFPKFFEGGGKLFSPFQREAKYTIVKEK